MFPITDPLLIFTALISIMLLAPLLSERLRMPDLVFLLLAGMILGPHGLGILSRNTAVTMFGSVGMLYIMFMAGLDIDLYRFAQSRTRGIIFGLLTFAIPQTIGTLVGYYILDLSLVCSILLASMLASHTLLAYPVAGRLGISRTEPVAVAVGATMLTDILALLVLAVIADSTRGESLGVSFWLSIFGGLAGLILLTWYGIPRLTRWFFISVTETGGTQFVFVLFIVCGCSYLSHYAKMEPIIGAFLAGIAFSRLIPEQSVLRSRISFTGHTIFIPFFLISVGMLVNLRDISGGWNSLLTIASMIIVVIVAKYIAAWLAGRLFGYSKDAVKVMFGLSVVQAAATLAAVVVGYELKLFDETILNGAMAMIVVTCPLGSWTVNHYGRRLTNLVQVSDYIIDNQQRIMVPVSKPVRSSRLLDLSFLIRDKSLPGEIRALTIVHDGLELDQATSQAERLLADCLTHAAAADMEVMPSLRVDLNVSDGIIHAAKELQSDLVMVGWAEGQAIRNRIFGSLMENLLNSCPSRLLFCRLVSQPNTTGRVNLFLPPFSAKRIDIKQLATEIKDMARQSGSELRIYLAKNDSAILQDIFANTGHEHTTSYIECESLAQMRQKLFADMKKDDMVVISGERHDSPLWNPTVEKLPDILVNRFANNSMLVAFPPLILEKNRDTSVIMPTEPAGVLPFQLYGQDLSGNYSLEHTIKKMVNNVFEKDQKLCQEGISVLLNSMAYPVEMSSGIVLLHGHCEYLTRPALIVGHNPDLWRISSLNISARHLLLLLSPKNQPADIHLRSLAELARKFHNPDVATSISLANNAGEICELIRNSKINQ